ASRRNGRSGASMRETPLRQRFGRGGACSPMQSNPDFQPSIHPALMSFANECCATLARLIAYVGTLALFGIVGLHFWDLLQGELVAAPMDQPGFTLALRSRPAFAISSLDPP